MSKHLTHVSTRRWEILAGSTRRMGSLFARVTSIETNPWLPLQRIILRWFMIQNMNTRSTQALLHVRRGRRKPGVWQIIVPLTLGREFGDLRDIVYKSQWEFREDRQAFLVLYRAQRISIPDAFLDLALRDDNPIPDVRTKNVVTNLWLCPAFAMYMSNKCAFSSVWGNKGPAVLIIRSHCSQRARKDRVTRSQHRIWAGKWVVRRGQRRPVPIRQSSERKLPSTVPTAEGPEKKYTSKARRKGPK